MTADPPQPKPAPAARLARFVIFLTALLTLAALGGLFLFNPTEHGFFPRCFFNAWTGLDCPGCGGLRAMHQLLHGHLLAAFQFNPLLIALLPLGLWWFASWTLENFFHKTLPQPFQSARWPWVLAILVVAFGVLRNLPWHAWLGT